MKVLVLTAIGDDNPLSAEEQGNVALYHREHRYREGKQRYGFAFRRRGNFLSRNEIAGLDDLI